MAKDKFDEFDDSFKSDVNDSAARARNRTVMLTPEITGQVRARLSRDSEAEEKSAASFLQPDAENEYVPTRRPINYQNLDQERADSENFNGISQKTLERAEVQSGATKNGVNPISREIHQIPVATAAGKKFSDDESDDFDFKAEAVEPSSKVESSLPYLKNPRENDDSEQNASGRRASEDYVLWSKITPVVGFLVSFDSDPNGQIFEIRSGRAIISSEIPNGGNYLFLTDESVSPMHAIIRVTEDYQFQVLDNLSEFGTTIVRPETGEELNLSGDKALVRHGDLIRFGKRSFSVCLIGS